MVDILLGKKIGCEEVNKDVVTAPVCRNVVINHRGHRMVYWAQTQAL